ncbi:MAG: FAD-dependent oxidoreductase [Thermoleophilaceae bacterium]
MLERRDEVIHDLDDSGQEEWVESKGIELFRAHGRLEGERKVRAGEDAAHRPQGRGAGHRKRHELHSDRRPRRRQSLEQSRGDDRQGGAGPPGRYSGAGVVGVEMAQAWCALGAQVTLIEDADRPLLREEPFAGEQVQAALIEAGVEVRCGATATAVNRNADDEVVIDIEGGPAVVADEILVATGRHPLDRRPGPGDRRARAGRVRRGRRPDAGRRRGRRLALRDWRREWARAAHPHGQVPGAGRRRRDPGRRLQGQLAMAPSRRG